MWGKLSEIMVNAGIQKWKTTMVQSIPRIWNPICLAPHGSPTLTPPPPHSPGYVTNGSIFFSIFTIGALFLIIFTQFLTLFFNFSVRYCKMGRAENNLSRYYYRWLDLNLKYSYLRVKINIIILLTHISKNKYNLIIILKLIFYTK